MRIMLSQQRQKIDAIDQQLVKLYEERMATVQEIITIKKENNLPILDQGREDQVIAKVQSYLNDDSYAEDIAQLYQEIMRLSREYQGRQ